MMKITTALTRAIILSAWLSYAPHTSAQTTGTDLTSNVPGAVCDDDSYWTISYLSANTTGALLQCDTWSSRGNNDGSQMTTPFMEYWHEKNHNGTSSLPAAQIRHQTITHLPKGRYKISMRVRCYCETYDSNGTTLFNGVCLYANNELSEDFASAQAAETTAYGTGLYIVGTPEVECEVGDDGKLDFGLNIISQSKMMNWVAWKDVKLTYLSGTLLTAGSYALRHKATGLYLCAGGFWGTQAVLGTHPQMVTLEEGSAEGHYIINTTFDENADGFLASHEGTFYLDLQDSEEMEIMPGNGTCHTIKSSQGYMGFHDDGSPVKAILSTFSDSSDDDAQWELISQRQLIEGLLATPSGTTADATFLISNPRYDHANITSDWEGSQFNTGGYSGQYDGYGNYCAEVWNTNFDVHQTITHVPNGTYRITLQGFYRYNNRWDNDNSVALSTHQNGQEKLYAQLYANQVSTPLQSIASEHDNISAMGLTATSAGLPFNMEEAARAFTAGLYSDTQLEVTVTDHQLVIGVRKSQQDGCDWTIWDNFELTLLTLGDNSGYNFDDDDTPSYDDASPDNPVDMTSLIKNPGFDSASGWRGSPQTGGSWSNPNAEKYNTTFDVYQILTGLPNGWYRLSAQGFYRYGDYHDEQHKSYYGGGWQENDANNIYAVYTIPYAVVSRKLGTERHLATLYANDVETGLPSPFDYAHETATHSDDYGTELGWVPDTQTGASQAFDNGEYPVELMVAVTDGTMRLGVRKSLGYKYDWACWDNFHLEYLGKSQLVLADGIETPATSIQMTVNQQLQLEAAATPATASNPTLTWTTSNSNIVKVDHQGMATATGTGSATITIKAKGSEGGNLVHRIAVSVTDGGSPSRLIINEIQVSNLDMFVDPSYNYGGYMELYNPTTTGVNLDGLYISDDAANLMKYRLTNKNGAIAPNGYGVLWFEHHDVDDAMVDLELDMDGGTLFLSDANGNIIASQTYPSSVSRTSYARTTDGGDTWAMTAYPTPGASNAGSREWVNATTFSRLPMPEVSQSSQLINGTTTVSVDIPTGATLYYTTDGSTPTDSHGTISSTGLFDIDKTTILRLRFYQKGLLPSAVRTCSYLLRDHDYMLPVLSVVSDPVNFFDDTLGVFVTGTNGVDGGGISFPCNWNMEWDRPVSFNYISADNQEKYSQEVSLERFGGWSRSWYPFNFKLKAQKAYEGLNYIAYQPFSLKPSLKHKVWQLRNGGNDLYCRIKDVAIHQIIMTSGFYLDCQDYLPVHSFINGQYQGMLNLREPSNKHFAYANYGIDTDEMDQLELGGGWTVNAGTQDSFEEWRSLSANAADEEVYRQICDRVDIDEYINYMAAQIFLGGDDWPGNNCKAFKGHDGKWHIVLFDVDQALRFDAYAFDHINSNSSCPLVEIFLNMMNNDTFRKQFIDTFCLVGGSVFEPQRSSDIINRLSAEMDPALALEGLSTQPTANYVKTAISATRRNKMMAGLASWNRAQISSTAQRIKMRTNISAGCLQLNGINVPTGRFDGTLFAPAIVKATAPEGFAFKGWYDGNNRLVGSDETLDLSGMTNVTLTARYEPLSTDEALLSAIATPVKVNEVSAGNSVYVNDWYKKNDWIELYNNTDVDIDAAGLYVSDDIDQPLKYQITANNGMVNTTIPARGHLVVWADNLEPLTQIHTGFKLANDSGNVVTVASSDVFVANNDRYFSEHPGMESFVDGITYVSHRGDHTVGRYPDGASGFYLMSHPTYSQSNILLTTDRKTGEDISLMGDYGDFTLQLAKGWNWISHNLSTAIGTTHLSSNVQRIVGATKEAYNDTRYGMTGTLKSLDAGNLYKVEMKAADNYACQGSRCRDNMPISLHAGWNWIGYPVEGAQSISAALADYVAEEGDMLMGQDGFSTYSGGRWSGSLTTLETGKGYMMRCQRANTLRFHSPSVRLNLSRMSRRGISKTGKYGIDKHAYPNVMGMIAILMIDGEKASPERFTLLAFSSEECRGMAQWTDSLAFLTIYGDSGEPIHYRAIDNVDGTVYDIIEKDAFTPSVKGTKPMPCQLTLGPESGDATIIQPALAHNSRQSGIEGYYSLSGTLMSRRAATLPRGVYIMRRSDGTAHKINIQ